MKKIIFALLMMVISMTAFAVDWRYITESSDTTYYVDTQTISRVGNGKITIWILQNQILPAPCIQYLEVAGHLDSSGVTWIPPHTDYATCVKYGDKIYDSSIQKWALNCANKTYDVGPVTHYRGWNGTGEVYNSSNGWALHLELFPGTIAEAIHHQVCYGFYKHK